MLTAPIRPPRRRRLLGYVLLTGLAGVLAAASVGLLRGARSVHVRPVVDPIGAEVASSGMDREHAAIHASLGGVGHP